MLLVMLLAVAGIVVLVVVALAEGRNLSRGHRRAGPLVRALIVVFLTWRVITWLVGS